LEPDPDHTGEGKRSSFLASEDAAVESKFFPLRIKTRIRHSRLSVGLTHQPDSEIINEEIQPSFFLLVHWHGSDVTRIALGTGGFDPLHL
jgi:hypothetical protein